jgi:undecaprenyl-phosphate 4-deoxy-4-formamido-L-arabinose transferase
MSAPQFSIVIPVYRSEKTLPELCDALHHFFEKSHLSYELILVNDACPNNTWETVKSIKAQHPNIVTAINLAKNAGQHHAILCGFQYVKGAFVITIDDDLQFHPNEIEKLIAQQKRTDADLVYGIQIVKEHSFIRNLGSKAVAFLFASFASTPGKGSSFRIIKADVVQSIKHFNQRYIFLDELLAWFASNTQFVEVNHSRRKEGKSGYSILKLVLWTLRLIFTYTTLPLRVMTYFGLMAFLICLGFVGYFLYMKFSFGAELGFTALIVSIFMSTGLILFSLGIIGEYLSRLFQLQTKRPVFFVKEVL